MAPCDPAIRNATIATALDMFSADIGIRHARIVTVCDAVESVTEAYKKFAEGECHVHLALNLDGSDPIPAVLGQELSALVKAGYTSLKVFTTYEDAASHPEMVAREQTNRAISHAELVDVPMMVVPVSGREAREHVRPAQSRGRKVDAETCPQHITLTAEDMQGLNRVGDAPDGKLNRKGKTSFRLVPNGILGVETRPPILFSEGVSKRGITPQKFVEFSSTNQANMYGICPQKDSMGIGFDADIALRDPARKTTRPPSILHQSAAYTPWESFEVMGWPIATHVRGHRVAKGGETVGDKGRGQIKARSTRALTAPPPVHLA